MVAKEFRNSVYIAGTNGGVVCGALCLDLFPKCWSLDKPAKEVAVEPLFIWDEQEVVAADDCTVQFRGDAEAADLGVKPGDQELAGAAYLLLLCLESANQALRREVRFHGRAVERVGACRFGHRQMVPNSLRWPTTSPNRTFGQRALTPSAPGWPGCLSGSP